MARFIMFYTEPAKRGLQRIQIGMMALLLPVALLMGVPAYQEYLSFQKATQHLIAADALAHQARNDEAMVELEKCVEAYPGFYEAYEMMASLQYDRKDRSKSIAAYNRGLEVLPDHGELHYGLAQMLYLEKRYDEAKRHAERATELLPGDARASHLVAQIESPQQAPAEPDLSHPPTQQ